MNYALHIFEDTDSTLNAYTRSYSAESLSKSAVAPLVSGEFVLILRRPARKAENFQNKPKPFQKVEINPFFCPEIHEKPGQMPTVEDCGLIWRRLEE